MHQIIQQFVGQEIGVNFEKPEKFEPVKLLDANPEFMSLETPGGRKMHFGMKWVVFVLEGEAQLGGGFGKKTRVPVLVQVHHFLVYRGGGGGVGVGVAF
ncbi:hypothetical protein [Rhodococcus sp. MEB064]|uniref:hypothetical protein n=1 Tax=Rhodococcus sp. MEB064 TaxID=1587522 RepID=UPI0012E0A77E|nr:hypothetical protein [Rhodococcus sp. MEB064]